MSSNPRESPTTEMAHEACNMHEEVLCVEDDNSSKVEVVDISSDSDSEIVVEDQDDEPEMLIKRKPEFQHEAFSSKKMRTVNVQGALSHRSNKMKRKVNEHSKRPTPSEMIFNFETPMQSERLAKTVNSSSVSAEPARNLFAAVGYESNCSEVGTDSMSSLSNTEDNDLDLTVQPLNIFDRFKMYQSTRTEQKSTKTSACSEETTKKSDSARHRHFLDSLSDLMESDSDERQSIASTTAYFSDSETAIEQAEMLSNNSVQLEKSTSSNSPPKVSNLLLPNQYSASGAICSSISDTCSVFEAETVVISDDDVVFIPECDASKVFQLDNDSAGCSRTTSVVPEVIDVVDECEDITSWFLPTFCKPKGMLKGISAMKLEPTLSDMVMACIDEGLDDKSAVFHMLRSVSTIEWKPKKKFIVYLINRIWKAKDMEQFEQCYKLLFHIHDVHGFPAKLNLWEMLEKAYLLDWMDQDIKEKELHIQIKSAMFKFICHILECEISSGSFNHNRTFNTNMYTTLYVWLEDFVKIYCKLNAEKQNCSDYFDLILSVQKLLSFKYAIDKFQDSKYSSLVAALSRIHKRLDNTERSILLSSIQLKLELRIFEHIIFDVSTYPTDLEVCARLRELETLPCSLRKIVNYHFWLEPKIVPTDETSPTKSAVVDAIKLFVTYLGELLEAYVQVACKEKRNNPQTVEDLKEMQNLQSHITSLQDRLRKKFPSESQDLSVVCSLLTLEMSCLHLES